MNNKPETPQQKKEYSEKTIALGKELDILQAVITTIDEEHLKSTYNDLRTQYEKMQLLDQTIHGNKLATDLLSAQCSTLLKLTELKRSIKKATDITNEIKGVKGGNNLKIV